MSTIHIFLIFQWGRRRRFHFENLNQVIELVSVEKPSNTNYHSNQSIFTCLKTYLEEIIKYKLHFMSQEKILRTCPLPLEMLIIMMKKHDAPKQIILLNDTQREHSPRDRQHKPPSEPVNTSDLVSTVWPCSSAGEADRKWQGIRPTEACSQYHNTPSSCDSPQQLFVSGATVQITGHRLGREWIINRPMMGSLAEAALITPAVSLCCLTGARPT